MKFKNQKFEIPNVFQFPFSISASAGTDSDGVNSTGSSAITFAKAASVSLNLASVFSFFQFLKNISIDDTQNII